MIKYHNGEMYIIPQELIDEIRADAIEFISDKLIYPLLDECDRSLWEHIDYIKLAKKWIKTLDDNPYPKVKNYREARKRDMRQWIAEQLKQTEHIADTDKMIKEQNNEIEKEKKRIFVVSCNRAVISLDYLEEQRLRIMKEILDGVVMLPVGFSYNVEEIDVFMIREKTRGSSL